MAPTRLTDRQKRDLLKLLRDAHGPNPLPWEEPLAPTKNEKLAITKKIELGLSLDRGECGYVRPTRPCAYDQRVLLNCC